MPCFLKRTSRGDGVRRLAGGLRGWLVNADVRYLGHLQPQVTIDQGTRQITGYINPLLFSVGVGLRW